MDMAARLDADGRIKDFRVMKTEDTPEYFEQALAAKERYLEITPAMPEVALPHVTGATFSSAGISKTLQLTARRFLATVQSKSASATSAARIPLTAAGVALMPVATRAQTTTSVSVIWQLLASVTITV